MIFDPGIAERPPVATIDEIRGCLRERQDEKQTSAYEPEGQAIRNDDGVPPLPEKRAKHWPVRSHTDIIAKVKRITRGARK